MRRLLALSAIGFLVLVAGGAAADTLTLTVVSQTNTTITLGWTPQTGYGYLFSANGTLVSRTNDPSRNTVKFAKANTYEVAVIVKGATGTYPTQPPPPPKNQCEDTLDNDGDGKIDYPADPGCTGLTDNDETDQPPPPPSGAANLWIDTNGGTCTRKATAAAYADAAACSSLVAAYNAASSGDLVLIRAGSYGDQNTGPRTGLTSQITFKPEQGATVTIGSMWDWGASFTNLDGSQGVLHVNGGFRVGWGGSRTTTITNVTLQHFDTKSVSQIDNASNLLIRDVDIGNYCSTQNDDALRMNDPTGAGGDSGDPHDVVIEDSTIGNICWQGSSQHPDCFAVSAGYNVTIRRNRFYQCGSQGLYLISELGGNIHDVTIENNMFGDCRTQGGYSNCVNSLILDVRSPGLRNVTVRYNSFAVGTQPMRVSGGTSSQNIQVYGNAGEGPGCENTGGVTYAYNVWDDAKCSTTDVTADPGFVSNAYGPSFDLHLASSSSPAVGRGDPSRVAADDYDKQSRPIGVVDAGADER